MTHCHPAHPQFGTFLLQCVKKRKKNASNKALRNMRSSKKIQVQCAKHDNKIKQSEYIHRSSPYYLIGL